MKYAIRVIETATGDVIKEIRATTERQCDAVCEGLHRQLNHDRYHVETCEADDGLR